MKIVISSHLGSLSPHSRILTLVLTAMISCFLLLPRAGAQLYTGSIAGTVTDPSGAVISSAHVELLDEQKGFTFNATTDNSGRYLFRQVPPGSYKVVVKAPGFQAQQKDDVKVDVNQNVAIDFGLKVGSSSQVVDVQASTVELQTQDAVTGQVVDRRFVNDLPLVGRSVLDLAYLTPGITEVDTHCSGCMANNFTSNGSRNATA